MLSNHGAGEDLWVPWTARKSNQSILKEISPEYLLKDWCWSWNSNTLATWCEKLTHWKRPWCWERLKAGGEGHDRGYQDGWMTSPTQCTWVWVNSGSWWWTAKPGVLQSMGSQRVRHDWVIEPNWILMINNIFLWTKNGSIWALSTICKDDLIQNNYQIFPHKERIVMSLKTQDIGIWIIILTSDISQVYFVILIITLLYVLWITLLALIQILTDKSPCFPDVTHENSHKLVKGNWDLFIQSNGYFK